MEKTACRVICKYTFLPQEDTCVQCWENEVTGKKKKNSLWRLPVRDFFLRFKSKQTSSYTCLYGPEGRAGHSSNNTTTPPGCRFFFLNTQEYKDTVYIQSWLYVMTRHWALLISVNCVYIFSAEFTGPLMYLEVKVFYSSCVTLMALEIHLFTFFLEVWREDWYQSMSGWKICGRG